MFLNVQLNSCLVCVKLFLTLVVCGCSAGDSLAYTLQAFVELMDHGIVSWDVLEHKFIKIVSRTLQPDIL